MTRSDRPFQRPASGTRSDSPDEEFFSESPWVEGDAPKPLILDPAFHQSVWKPWDGPSVDPSTGLREDDPAEGPSAATSPKVTRLQRMGWTLVGALVLIVVASLVIPSFTQTSFDAARPLVMSFPTQPTVAWTADGGDQCAESFPEDHMIMSDDNRVWSMDLRNGLTKWSVSFPTRFSSSICLPGSNLVAVTEALVGEPSFDVTLLDGSTGETVAVLPSTSTVQVIPLGSNIGLLGPDNVLSMVTRDNLNSPLWTHAIPGPPVGTSSMYVLPIGDDAIQLVWSLEDVDWDRYESRVLSLDDGRVPGWAEDFGFPSVLYTWEDSVVMHVDLATNDPTVTALDREGQELWSRDNSIPVVLGPALYLAKQTPRGTLSDLREVNPETGTPVDDRVFTGEFANAWGTSDGLVVVRGEESLTLLDEDLAPTKSFDSEEFRFWIEGEEQMFLGAATNVTVLDEKLRLSAISREDSSVLWTLDLQNGQDIEQMGKFLILRDHSTNTVHGLWSSTSG